jgi:glycine hydroxymethyltransferase
MSKFFTERIENDEVLAGLMKDEFLRQNRSIELIASENFTSPGVIECLGSILTNKYSEGYPGKRYYGGNQYIDKIEQLCQTRALKAFNLESEDWEVNVQPYSGSPANLAVYMGLINPGDRIMGLGLTSGGHLTHGFYTPKKKISASSIFFQSLPYHVNKEGLIDYEELEKTALNFLPRILICGGSSYPRDYDYQRLKEIADSIGAYLMVDMAHFSGFVATQLLNNPFDYADIVTSTTHKTLRGPRSGLIFINKKKENGTLVNKINEAVFPGLQGGPHNHQIAGVAYQLEKVTTPEFVNYMKNVKTNAQILASALIDLGFTIVTGGTDNHIVLVDLKSKDLTGSKMELLCEEVDISLNKNCIYGDKNAMSPSGIRLGTAAMTTRGLNQEDFKIIAFFIKEIAEIALEIQHKYGKLMTEFKKGLHDEEIKKKIEIIKVNVNKFSSEFPFYD